MSEAAVALQQHAAETWRVTAITHSSGRQLQPQRKPQVVALGAIRVQQQQQEQQLLSGRRLPLAQGVRVL
jgi:hypothetical protein